MKPTLWLVPALSISSWTMPLRAADAPSADGVDPAALFSKLDTNQDGKLSADEVPQEHQRLFQRLVRIADKDRDGILIVAEFTAGLKPADGPATGDSPSEAREKRRPEKADLGKLLKRMDTNGDGKVTLDEVPEKRREQFQKLLGRLDRDGDKVLSSEELDRLSRYAGGKPGESKPADSKPAEAAEKPAEKPAEAKTAENGAAKKAGKFGGGDPKGLFARLDKNGDGKLTADEAPEERKQFLERMVSRGDKDGDKAVSLQEFIALGRERMKQGASEGQRPGRPQGEAGRPPRGGLIAALDADGDGKLSSGEISAAGDALRKLDKDGDGELTPREIFATAPQAN